MLGTAESSDLQEQVFLWKKDYCLGGSPLWQVFRVAYRMTRQPIDAVGLLFGYCWAAIRRVERPVSPELMRFHRQEQMQKLTAILSAVLRFKKVDSFRVITAQNRGSL